MKRLFRNHKEKRLSYHIINIPTGLVFGWTYDEYLNKKSKLYKRKHKI